MTAFTGVYHGFPTTDSAKTKVEITMSKTNILATNDVLFPYSQTRVLRLSSQFQSEQVIIGYGRLIQLANPFRSLKRKNRDNSTTFFGNYQDREEEERNLWRLPLGREISWETRLTP